MNVNLFKLYLALKNIENEHRRKPECSRTALSYRAVKDAFEGCLIEIGNVHVEGLVMGDHFLVENEMELNR